MNFIHISFGGLEEPQFLHGNPQAAACTPTRRKIPEVRLPTGRNFSLLADFPTARFYAQENLEPEGTEARLPFLREAKPINDAALRR